QFWRNAAARTYNVNSIPATFLIDGDGIIIKKNLRGKALENTLASLKR
ncbi:MAG: TlpA family protein disulfide reductase, partial [Bacteroidetes bacterium]